MENEKKKIQCRDEEMKRKDVTTIFFHSPIFSRRFSKKNADYSSDFSFFKTNEVTDFISFYKLVCSFVHLLGRLIFRLREAGERGFESRTKQKYFKCFQK